MTLVCKWCGNNYETVHSEHFGYHNHCYYQKIRSVVNGSKSQNTFSMSEKCTCKDAFHQGKEKGTYLCGDTSIDNA